MDQKSVCEALKVLRASKPGLSNYARFTKASGIHRPTVERTEDGSSLPSILTIKKWVEACGLTLAQFFAQFQEQPAADPSFTNIQVKQSHKELHRKLEDILNGDDKDAALWISGNLTVFHRDLGRKSRR